MAIDSKKLTKVQLVIGLNNRQLAECNRKLVIDAWKLDILWCLDILDSVKFLDRLDYLNQLEMSLIV